jgi:hypothetical protein
MDILGIDDDTLDAMDKFKRAAVAIFDGLRRLAPAAIEDRVGGCNSAGAGALVLRMTPTSTLSAVRVWLLASDRISVMVLVISECTFLKDAFLSVIHRNRLARRIYLLERSPAPPRSRGWSIDRGRSVHGNRRSIEHSCRSPRHRHGPWSDHSRERTIRLGAEIRKAFFVASDAE